MMTAVSFILGILPLILSSGAGAGARQAVGVTIFGGMVAATSLGLLLTPVSTSSFSDWPSICPSAWAGDPMRKGFSF